MSNYAEQTNVAPLYASPKTGGDLDRMMSERSLITEVQSLLKQQVATAYEIGARVAALKDITDHGRFLTVLSTEFNGMPQRTARNYITFYQRCEQFPKLQGFAESNFSKALTLFNGLEDEELSALEAGEIQVNGETLEMEDIDKMSVRQLKSEIKRLRRPIDDTVKEETRSLEQERNQLIEENKALHTRLDDQPSVKDAYSAAMDAMRRADQAVSALLKAAKTTPGLDQAEIIHVRAQMAAFQEIGERHWDQFLAWEAETAERAEETI